MIDTSSHTHTMQTVDYNPVGGYSPLSADMRATLTKVSRRLFDNSPGRPVKAYLDAIGDIRTLMPDEERLLSRRALCGDKLAREAMILANLKLVAAIAKRYKNRGLSMQDLLQEGNIGLMKALAKFDPDKGHRFSTYAVWWIRESMTRALSNKSRTIRLPVHLTEFMTKLRRIRSYLSVNLGREPTAAEIAVEINVSKEKVEAVLNNTRVCTSLDKRINSDEGNGYLVADTVPDASIVDPEEVMDLNLVRDQINRILNRLSERERKVVRLRFGLGTGQCRKLREVSEEMGLTRDQVGKLSCKAMQKLRTFAEEAHLEDYLD